MTNFISQPRTNGLVKVDGTIQNLKVTRASASFVFTESDQTRMGVIAIAAAAAGLSGQAMATAANASAMEEEADYVEFELNGKPIKGWVWRNPFKDGDEVEVAAEWQGDHYEVFGMARPRDRTIALYPHCSRGRATHIKNAVKWWLIGAGGVILLFILFIQSISSGQALSKLIEQSIMGYVVGGVMSFFAIVTFSITRQWLPFVHLAEKVFCALGMQRPGNVDLVKSSKRQRSDKDPGEYGTFYFRY